MWMVREALLRSGKLCKFVEVEKYSIEEHGLNVFEMNIAMLKCKTGGASNSTSTSSVTAAFL